MNLFVYGTLCRGLSRNKILSASQYLGLAHIDGALVDLGHYPGLIKGAESVIGEIYKIDPEALLPRLDEIEGVNAADDKKSLYVRRKITARLFSTGERLTAGAYFFNGSVKGRMVIPHGDYRRYQYGNEEGKSYYLAYGSNLSRARLEERVGSVDGAIKGVIPGYCLTYNKKPGNDNGFAYANISAGIQGPDCPCAAYKLQKSQIEKLDSFEGAKKKEYIRTVLPMAGENGGTLMGYVYIAHPDRLVFGRSPAEDYRSHLLQGYKEQGLGNLEDYECHT